MVQKSAPRRRGRPPTYDPDVALGRALETFWAGGYAGTSLDDLAAATGMNRPSLYGAFGDKRALFLKAIGAYRARGGGVMARLGAEKRGVRDTLAAAFAAALDIYFGDGPDAARGCFMTGAALASAVEDEDVRASLRAGFDEIDRSFARLFARARRDGEIGPEADPAALAAVSSAVLHSLSVRARAGTDRRSLETQAEASVELILRAAA